MMQEYELASSVGDSPQPSAKKPKKLSSACIAGAFNKYKLVADEQRRKLQTALPKMRAMSDAFLARQPLAEHESKMCNVLQARMRLADVVCNQDAVGLDNFTEVDLKYMGIASVQNLITYAEVRAACAEAFTQSTDHDYRNYHLF